MAPKNLAELRRKRDKASRQSESWQAQLIHAAKMLKTWRRKEKLYSTLIEKILDEQKASQPKHPNRIVEV